MDTDIRRDILRSIRSPECSSGFLRTQLHDLYDSSDQTPTLTDLEREIFEPDINYMLPAAKYQDRIKWRIETLRKDTGEMTKCRNGYSLRNLLKRDVVFEFDNLPRRTQDFLMEILVAWIYRYRKAMNHRGGRLRHVTVLDEGHRMFSWYKEQQAAAGIPEINRLVKLMREFGESLITADQEASKLTDSIKANTMTKILLSVGDYKQYREITGSMDLSDMQNEWSQLLDQGSAVVQHGNTEPVPVRLKDFNLAKDVSDSMLIKTMSMDWQQLSYTPIESNQFGQSTLNQYSG